MAVHPFITAPLFIYLLLPTADVHVYLGGEVTHVDVRRGFLLFGENRVAAAAIKDAANGSRQRIPQGSSPNPPRLQNKAGAHDNRDDVEVRRRSRGGTIGCYRRRCEWMALRWMPGFRKQRLSVNRVTVITSRRNAGANRL